MFLLNFCYHCQLLIYITLVFYDGYKCCQDLSCVGITMRRLLTQVWSPAGRVSLAGVGGCWRAVCGARLDRVDRWYWCSWRSRSGFGHDSNGCRVAPLWMTTTHTGDINHPRFVFLLTDKVKSALNMCGCRTRIFFKSETSEAEVNPPLFPDIFLHQTVEEEDEKSWNWNKSEMQSWASEDKNWFLVCRSFLSQHILSNLHLSKAFLCQN